MSFTFAVALRRALAIGLVAAALTGCITVLPKAKPVALYRFGSAEGAATAVKSAAGKRFTVHLAPIAFDSASAGDRILTTDGSRVAYIAGARWVVPAPTLFESAAARAFYANGGDARLIGTGDPTPADYLLKLHVHTFEVRYGVGGKGPPTVCVEVYASLTERKLPESSRGRLFKVLVPADSNSVHAIVTAFDAAVGKVLAETVVWADRKGADT